MTLTKISMPYDLEALHHHNDLASLLRPDSPDPLSDAPPSQDSTTSSTQNPISYMTIPSSTTNMEHINMSLYSNTTARLEFRVPPFLLPTVHAYIQIPVFLHFLLLTPQKTIGHSNKLLYDSGPVTVLLSPKLHHHPTKQFRQQPHQHSNRQIQGSHSHLTCFLLGHLCPISIPCNSLEYAYKKQSMTLKSMVIDWSCQSLKT